VSNWKPIIRSRKVVVFSLSGTSNETAKFLSAFKPRQISVICDSYKRRNLRIWDSAKQQESVRLSWPTTLPNTGPPT